MKLLQTHNDKRNFIGVIEVIESPERLYIPLDGVYSRGFGISHYLVDDSGTQTRIDIQEDCPSQPPYFAIASPLLTPI